MKKYIVLAGFVLAAILVSQPSVRERVGPLADGGFLLPNGWRLHAAGKQVAVDTLPMSTAISPDKRYLLVLNGGYNPPSISVIDTASSTELSRTRVADAWLGLAFSPKGDFIYVGGGSRAAVYELGFQDGKLTPARTFGVVEDAKRVWSDFIGDVALTADGKLLYAADLYHDSVLVISTETGKVEGRVKTGRRPYRILFHPDGKTFFVSNWADGSVSQFLTEGNSPMTTLRVGAHASDMIIRTGKNAEGDQPWAARLFVAASNTNSVYTVGISEANELRQVENINVSMTPREPLGMTPSALGLSADGKQLYVVCSDANAVAVADISQDRTDVVGFIPTGWYPTAVRGLADGRIAIANGRGLRSYANPKGPSPLKKPDPPHLGIRSDEYVGKLQHGTIGFVDAPNDRALAAYTQTVLANSPYNDSKLTEAPPAVLQKIKHVIYVVKENRTYDPMLGDMKQGNGDASLVLFGENITPNQHKLAREFVLFDNFYVNSDVSADGHNWSTAAIASDYVQKFWPNSYAGRRKHYDYEGGEPAATPAAGYLWTNARQAGLSLRNYGYFVNNRPHPGPDGIQVDSVRDPVLSPLTNRSYRGFDLDYSDVERMKVLLKDLAGFESQGQMPQILLVRLGNDHTSGTTPGKVAPLASIADNDAALGMLVEGVSKTRFWPETAIFVLEDDAQNGADHVDSHRSPVFVLSPYTRRGVVDSTMYNTTSVLRTMEMILGMRPMTHFDAGARPMTSAFQTTPVTTPYTAVPAALPFTERNPADSPTAARSRKMDFEGEDRIDDDELNDILWLAVKGTHAPPPPPVRSFFSR